MYHVALYWFASYAMVSYCSVPNCSISHLIVSFSFKSYCIILALWNRSTLCNIFPILIIMYHITLFHTCLIILYCIESFVMIVIRYFGKCTLRVLTFVLGIPLSICCSGRSPGPRAPHGCRSSDRTNKHNVKIQSHTLHTFYHVYISSTLSPSKYNLYLLRDGLLNTSAVFQQDPATQFNHSTDVSYPGCNLV